MENPWKNILSSLWQLWLDFFSFFLLFFNKLLFILENSQLQLVFIIPPGCSLIIEFQQIIHVITKHKLLNTNNKSE